VQQGIDAGAANTCGQGNQIAHHRVVRHDPARLRERYASCRPMAPWRRRGYCRLRRGICCGSIRDSGTGPSGNPSSRSRPSWAPARVVGKKGLKASAPGLIGLEV
jgi:hypothetical protein